MASDPPLSHEAPSSEPRSSTDPRLSTDPRVSGDPEVARGRIAAAVRVLGPALRALSIIALVLAVVGGLAGAVVAALMVARDAIVWWVAAIPLALWLIVAVWVVSRLWRMATAARDAETFGRQMVEAVDVEWARERVSNALQTLQPSASGKRPGPFRTLLAWYRATRVPMQTLDRVKELPLLKLYAPRALRRTAWLAAAWAFLAVACPMATLTLSAFL